MRTLLKDLALLALILSVGTAYGATIYVNGSNTGPVTNGLTLATGWKTIAGGLTDLAATNALVQGGHTLIVGAGTYAEEVLLSGPAGGGHSGTAGNYNTVKAQGDVLIDGEWTTRDGIDFGSYCYYMHVNGFKTTRCRWGVIAWSAYYHTISNVTVSGCHGGISVSQGNTLLVGSVNRCTIVGNEYVGLQSGAGGGTVVRDCIIAFNGIGADEINANGDIALQYCVLYGNGVRYVDEASDVITDKDAIEALPGNPWHAANVSTGLVTQAPGYLGLGSALDLARVYAGAPIFTAASGGGVVGALPAGSYTTVALPSLAGNTYYVEPAPTGSDARGTNDAVNPATPWATIDRAAQSVREGDTVIVAADTYAEGVTVTSVCPRGGSISFQANGAVLVDGSGQTAALTLSGVNNIDFEGFSFANATHGMALEAVYGAGFTNCVFRGNAQDGVNARNTSATTFQTCDFFDNGYRGANLYADSHGSCQALSFYDCNLYSNRPSNNAWGVLDAKGAYHLKVDRCRIYDNDANNNFSPAINLSGYNTARHGLGAGFNSIRNCAVYSNNRGVELTYATPNTLVDNCVIYGSRYDGIGDGSNVGIYGFATVRNTVIAANNRYGHSSNIQGLIYQHCAFRDNVTAQYIDLPATILSTAAAIDASCTGGTNNVIPTADLAFVNASGGNFQIVSGSPLIDAGTATSPWTVDLYGGQRLRGSGVDIGAHEHEPPPLGTAIIVY